MRVLICGSRKWTDDKIIYSILEGLTLREGPIVLISGGAAGADSFAAQWAYANGIQHEEYLAEWELSGKAAGPIRNQHMLEDGKPDIVIGFPTAESIGTYDMLRRSAKAGVPTFRVEKYDI
jgi:hypothetical protein